VAFAARIEALEVEVNRPARVVVNERTGTIVAGGNVRIAPVAISHGGLTIEVKSQNVVSQPAPFSPKGETIVTTESDVEVTDRAAVMSVPGTTSLAELAEALNTLGVSSSDVIAIFQALREVGALDAELVVI
jgi:flagellar P-ring protein precursor FlgI